MKAKETKLKTTKFPFPFNVRNDFYKNEQLLPTSTEPTMR